MNALPWRTAKANLAFSVGSFGVLAEYAARQDGGDFGGALGGGELVGRGEELECHAVSSRCEKELDTIVMSELVLDHPGISSV